MAGTKNKMETEIAAFRERSELRKGENLTIGYERFIQSAAEESESASKGPA